MRRLLAPVVAVVGTLAALVVVAAPASAQFEADELEKTQLVDTTLNPMEIEVAPDGTVFYVEKRGVMGAWDPISESSSEIGTLSVNTSHENGLLGIALAPDYEISGWIYLFYSATSPADTQRISRFQLDGDGDLDLGSEQPIFEFTHQRAECCHSAGALEFDPDGNLLLSTGDNVNPFASQGYAPIDEQAGREPWDAQRTSANTNDHNGKLLRIAPEETILPGTEPGIGDTYEIPSGNLFPVGTDDTQPEIYAMGFRNPFRFKVDEETGWSLLADYGPDAQVANPDRGPQGAVEFNVITEPGNFGWPYCIRESTPYVDWTFPSGPAGDPFDCEAPVNESPNNTGLTNLPPVQPATMWQGFTETDPRVPGLGTGGAPMAGPRYYYDPSNPSPTKFPPEADGKWFIASWNNDWIKTVDLDEEAAASNVEDFPALGGGYQSPMDMEFGPDGSLYLAEWGQGFAGEQPNSGIYRIDYLGASTAPEVSASADPDTGNAPLEVQFDAEGTDAGGDPDPSLTYEWDFGDGEASTEEDPVHTYTDTGSYTATVTVTDPDTLETGSDSVEIVVTALGSCPRSDDFDGPELDPDRWTVIREEADRLSFSDGALNVVSAPNDIYANEGGLPNIILQPIPGGGSEPWSITTEMSWNPSQNYQNAGLMVYEDDDHYIKTGMVWNGSRNFELIKELDATPVHLGETSAASVPEDEPFFMRYISDDGTSVVSQFSTDGESWTDVGTPTDLTGLTDPMIGIYAMATSQAGAAEITANFHSVTVAPECEDPPIGDCLSDDFDGDALDAERWEVIRRDDERLSVADGALNLVSAPADIFGGQTGMPNIVVQPLPGGGSEPWSITTEMTWDPTQNFQNAGLIVYGDDDNYVKTGMVWNGARNFELIKELEGTAEFPGNAGAGDLPSTYFLRLVSADGNAVTSEFSADGETWTEIGTTDLTGITDPRIGVYATASTQAGAAEITANFHSVAIEPDCPPTDCFGDAFDGASLDAARWNAIVREDDSLYRVEDGTLWVETVGGDIYETGDPSATRNFLLQSADHAGDDWTIETKVLGGALAGGYSQGGLLAYADDDNYVKLDVIADDGQTAINRIELRSEVAAAIQDPQPQLTPLPADTEDVWLRLTKAGTTYSGEYSFDGESWTEFAESVTNEMGAPSFGLFTLGVNSPGPEVGFEYFALDGEIDCEPDENSPPVIDEVSADPTAGFAPLEVDFTAAASDADGEDLTYSWDFGDGNTSTEQNPTHTYTDAGEHEATVTVSDGTDETSESVDITVLGEDDPEARFRVLAFSLTEGFRHSSIDEGHTALDLLAEDNDFQVDHTEDASLFTEEILAAYDTVAFLSTTGDVLNEAQQDAFEAYIQGGGGYTGIHSASDTEYTWPWYGELVGAYFRNHPPGTPTATVGVEDHDHASTTGLPDSYVKVDEWYNFQSPIDPVIGGGGDDYSPRPNVHVLATVDESTYDEQDGNATDDDHPVIWCQRYDGGRSWYTAMGHTEASYLEAEFLQQVLGGLETTAGVTPSATCGVEGSGDTTPPQTTDSLDPEDPGEGGTYDGPVSVTLSATDPGEGGGEPQTHDVAASGFTWNPSEVDATVGDTVEWDWSGGFHDVCIDTAAPTGPVAADDCGDDEVVADSSQTGGAKTFTEPGTFEFYCSIHYPGMEGTVNVAEGGGGPGSGVDITEYRVNTDGATGEWVESENTGADDPFETTFTVSDEGEHVVEYRSTDVAGNVEEIGSVAFGISDGGSADPSVSIDSAPKRLKAKAFLKRGLRATASCEDVTIGTMQLYAQGSAARKLGFKKGKRKVLAKSKVSCGPSGEFSVRLKPTNGKVKRGLKKLRGNAKTTLLLEMSGDEGEASDRAKVVIKGKKRKRR